MIFTASSVSSLSQSLHCWEWAEYISEAFVILACAGELVADLGENWLGEKRKRHLERRSTILLVAALSVSLICLVRTNELSGTVIGSLGDRADEADSKAQRAITDSGTALTKAGEATSKVGTAEDIAERAVEKSNKASSAASNALGLAHHAEETLAWRRLTKEQQGEIALSLMRFHVQSASIQYLATDHEADSFASDIASALRETIPQVSDPLGAFQMNEGSWTNERGMDFSLNHGVWIGSTHDQDSRGAADLIKAELCKFGFDTGRRASDFIDQKKMVVILVEPRPPGPQGNGKAKPCAEENTRK